jgi:hypothetical protein
METSQSGIGVCLILFQAEFKAAFFAVRVRTNWDLEEIDRAMEEMGMGQNASCLDKTYHKLAAFCPFRRRLVCRWS